jgi:hypothetical protein
MSGLVELCVRAKNKIKHLLIDTPIEVAIGAVVLAVSAAYVSHRIESNRDKLIPLAFSELSQIEDDAKAKGEKVDPLTKYHASLNDTVMKVLESWNDAWRHSTSKSAAYTSFAEFLGQRMERKNDFRHKLPDLLEELPKDADAALGELSDFAQASARVRRVNSDFRRAWSYSSYNHYRTETRTRTKTVGSGKNRRTVREKYTVQVYDGTTHTYNYDRGAGEAASSGLDSTLKDFDDLTYAIKMTIASHVQAENLEAIKSSRKKKDGEEMSDAEALKLACTWRFGSNIAENQASFSNPWSSLRADAAKWRASKSGARSRSYRTSFRTDSGPSEYRVVEAASRSGEYFVENIDEVIKGMELVKRTSPQLDTKIRDFIGVMLYPDDAPGVERKPKEMAYALRELATQMYQKNFKGGFDIKGYRAGMVVLYGFLGLILGGLAGYGVDRAGEKWKLWGKKEDNWNKREGWNRSPHNPDGNRNRYRKHY